MILCFMFHILWCYEFMIFLFNVINKYILFQINSVIKTTDKSVAAEITILTNVTDNEAIYRCEAANSATEIPLFESVTMSVHCKYDRRYKNKI